MSGNKSGQGNNSAGKESLNIPRLGGDTQPVRQAGEEPEGAEPAAAPKASEGDVILAARRAMQPQQQHTDGMTTTQSLQQTAQPQSDQGEAIPVQDERQEQAAAHVAEVSALATLDDNALYAEMQRRHAKNNPAMFFREREQQAHTPPVTVSVPGAIVPGENVRDKMDRPDLDLQPVDMMRWKDKAEEMAFLEEYLVIKIHETAERGAVNPVVLGINGRQVAIYRGKAVMVRRKYVERLMRARSETMETEVVMNGSQDPKNLIHKRGALRFPFAILEDKNPRGRQWEEKILAEAQ